MHHSNDSSSEDERGEFAALAVKLQQKIDVAFDKAAAEAPNYKPETQSPIRKGRNLPISSRMTERDQDFGSPSGGWLEEQGGGLIPDDDMDGGGFFPVDDGAEKDFGGGFILDSPKTGDEGREAKNGKPKPTQAASLPLSLVPRAVGIFVFRFLAQNLRILIVMESYKY